MKKFLKDERGVNSVQLILIISILLSLAVFFIAPRIIDSIKATKNNAEQGLDASYTDVNKEDLFVGNDVTPGSKDFSPPSLYSNLVTRTVRVTDTGSSKETDFISAHLSAKFEDKSGIDYIKVYKDGNLIKNFNRESVIERLVLNQEGEYSLIVADRLYALRSENSSYNSNEKTYRVKIDKNDIPIDVRVSKITNGKPEFTIRRIGTKTGITRLEVTSNNGSVSLARINYPSVERTTYELDVLKNDTYTLKVTDSDGNILYYDYVVSNYTPTLDVINSFIYGKVTVKPSNLKSSDIIQAKWMEGHRGVLDLMNNGTDMIYNNGYSNTIPVNSGSGFTMYFETRYHNIIYHITTTYKNIYTPGLPEAIEDSEKAITIIEKTITNK